ncbi:hypothetical protein [Bradyrhizobium liaoningense]|uniref:hypothetical protein n=1 Tax=Bradyrhizobium liaoningense TaxID=43992 RepID=UPI001BA6D303|nr:hypothetical protein [Bradyrhizobium liaoningense]MBR0719395.1 hypothetical protein [Bradyrhizobium liaoningense]
MPNFTPETAVARYAVTPLDSPVNILQLVQHLSERAEEISARFFAASSAAQDELDALEAHDLGDELNHRRKSLAEDLLEIEIAAHDLAELVDLLNNRMS